MFGGSKTSDFVQQEFVKGDAKGKDLYPESLFLGFEQQILEMKTNMLGCVTFTTLYCMPSLRWMKLLVQLLDRSPGQVM